jgi:hypothetical protein
MAQSSLKDKFYKYYNGYLKNSGYNEEDIALYVRLSYFENLIALGKIAMKCDEKKEFYEERATWLKAEIEALTDYSDKNNINLTL